MGVEMKTTDLIEALQCANSLFKKKHGMDMEIFDMEFSEDGYDGAMHVQAVGEVEYGDAFGWGTKSGKKPHADFKIDFCIEDGKISDRSVTFEDAP